MKICYLSDTHSLHEQVNLNLSGVDMIIHAGDLSNRGYEWEVRAFLDWFNSLPVKYRVFIAGNHDWFFQNQRILAQELLTYYPDLFYLENSGVNIEGIKLWGSPQTPFFYNWAFNIPREKIYHYWELIPLDTDILITHGPPYRIGDLVTNQYGTERNQGCHSLLERVLELKPQVHVFGHIHSGNGIYTNKDTTFINASVLDEDYHYCYNPKILEYEK